MRMECSSFHKRRMLGLKRRVMQLHVVLQHMCSQAVRTCSDVLATVACQRPVTQVHTSMIDKVWPTTTTTADPHTAYQPGGERVARASQNNVRGDKPHTKSHK